MEEYGKNGFDIKTIDPIVQQPLGRRMSRIHPMTPEENRCSGQQRPTSTNFGLGHPHPTTPFGIPAPTVQFGMTVPAQQDLQFTMAPPHNQQFAMAQAQLQNPQYAMGMTAAQNNAQYAPPILMPPPGLAYLSTMSHILIKQQMDLLELVTGFENNNRYQVLTPQGMLLFNAIEKSDTCDRQCYGASRAFTLEVNDLAGQPLIILDRPFQFCGLQEMSVFSPPGVLVGTIRQEWSMTPKFIVNDSEGLVVFRIEGPYGACSCGGDVDFQVLSASTGTEVGKISKQWTGLLQEMYTNADTFGISFPPDLAISMKSILLGACFLIDYMYFEHPKHQGRRF